MGFLDENYHKERVRTKAEKIISSASSTSTVVQEFGQKMSSFDEKVQGFTRAGEQNLEKLSRVLTTGEGVPAESETASFYGPISKEEQIKKFGGEVGSEEYGKYLASHPVKPFIGKTILESAGLKMPTQEEWDLMDRAQKSLYTVAATQVGAQNFFANIPKATVGAFGSLRRNIKATFSGKTFEELSGEPVEKTKLAFIESESPTLFQTHKQARDAGYGPWSAALLTGTKAIGDVFMLTAVADFSKAFYPRKRFSADGKPLTINVEEVKQVISESQKKGEPIAKVRPVDSPNEYKKMSQSDAKKYGGLTATTDNTYWKVTPAGVSGDSIEFSVVRVGKGKAKGDFGPETKVQSWIVPVERAAAQSAGETTYRGASITEWESVQNTGKFERPSGERLIDKKTGKEIRTPDDEAYNTSPDKRLADLYAQGSSKDGVVIEFKPEAKSKMKFSAKFDSTDLKADEYLGTKLTIDDVARVTDKNGKIIYEATTGGKINTVSKPKTNFSTKSPTLSTEEISIERILAKPLRGVGEYPITNSEISNLQKIVAQRKIDPQVADSVMRVTTGKSVISDLTNAEFVNLARGLDAMIPVTRIERPVFLNPLAEKLSPVGNYFSSVENRYKIPVKSEVYIPVEEAAWLKKMAFDKHRDLGREMHGKYAGPGYAEDRRLIRAHIEGDNRAILLNKDKRMTPERKQELLEVANKVEAGLEKLRKLFGLKKRQNYQSQIKNLGGVFQLYKEGAEFPSSFDFFAEHPRTGSIGVSIDDSLALWDIFGQAGYNKLYYNPVLERAAPFVKTLQPELQGSVKNYVQEKLGYGGRFEKAVDDLVKGINRNSGLNLAPDIGRKTLQHFMGWTYSALLPLKPATLLRDAMQDFFLVIPRMGAKFYPEAKNNAFDPKVIQKWKDRGILVEGGVPTGEAIAREAGVGGRAETIVRNATQGLLQKTYGVGDKHTRVVAAEIWELRWEDAIARMKKGDINYRQFEDLLEFQKFDMADANFMRQRIMEGDIDRAFLHGARTLVDELIFPYRRATSAPALFGAGKIPGQLLTWPIHYAHTLGRWVKTGQWDNLIRFFGMATVMKRTFKETFGLDIGSWVGLNPLNPTPGPVANVGIETMMAISSWIDGNAEELEKHKSDILRTIGTISHPGGAARENLFRFKWDIELSEKYHYQTGVYGVFSSNGKLIYKTDFKGLMKDVLLGLPTTRREGERKLQEDLRNIRFFSSSAKKNALELRQKGKIEESNRILIENKINLEASDFDAYKIPLNMRTFQTLPSYLKPKFIKRVLKSNE